MFAENQFVSSVKIRKKRQKFLLYTENIRILPRKSATFALQKFNFEDAKVQLSSPKSSTFGNSFFRFMATFACWLYKYTKNVVFHSKIT